MTSAAQRYKVATQLVRWAADPDEPSSDQAQRLRRSLDEDLPWMRTRRLESLAYLALGVDAAPQRLYDAVLQLQRSALRSAVEALIAAEVRPLVFKGAELMASGFGDRSVGSLADCDLIVPRSQIGLTRRVLHRLGYRQARFVVEAGGLQDWDFREIAQMESSHYELAPFARLTPVTLDEGQADVVARAPLLTQVFAVDRGFVANTQIDVHFKPASHIEVDELFDRSEPSALGIGRTLCPTDHLWVILGRAYVESALHGKRSMRDFAYLAPLLASNDIDWDVVLASAERFRLYPALYYYLSFLSETIGGGVPRRVLDALASGITYRTKDFGWQLAHFFEATDPMPSYGPTRQPVLDRRAS